MLGISSNCFHRTSCGLISGASQSSAGSRYCHNHCWYCSTRPKPGFLNDVPVSLCDRGSSNLSAQASHAQAISTQLDLCSLFISSWSFEMLPLVLSVHAEVSAAYFSISNSALNFCARFKEPCALSTITGHPDSHAYCTQQFRATATGHIPLTLLPIKLHSHDST